MIAKCPSCFNYVNLGDGIDELHVLGHNFQCFSCGSLFLVDESGKIRIIKGQGFIDDGFGKLHSHSIPSVMNWRH